jgi:hypothetical protein
VAEPVVGEEGASPPRPVAAEVESVEARVLDEPDAVARELAVPETVAKATTSEIQVAEETGTSLSQAALAARPERLSSRALRGWLPLGLTLTLRTTRRPRRATPWSVR